VYSFRNDPGADGVGIAFFDAVAPDGGRLDLGTTDSSRWRAQDWDLVEDDLGVRVATVRQVHGDQVLVIDRETELPALAWTPADGLITTSAGVALAVRAADCLPVVLADPEAGVVGAAHAGRVGLAAGVLVRLAERMRGLGASSLTAWIGPHICGACYEVPDRMQDEFSEVFPTAAAQTSWGTPSLDLGAAAESQLVALGCTVRRVDPCTFTSGALHSFRRDGAAAGRQAGLVWLP
jgi:YfiH family protein